MSLPQAFLVFSFFFKHKTAYELLISDWCSDVCSSDLYPSNHQLGRAAHPGRCRARRGRKGTPEHRPPVQPRRRPTEDRPAKPASTARAPAAPPRRRRSHRQCRRRPAGSCRDRSEEHTSELKSLMRISYAVFCLKKKITKNTKTSSTKHIIKHKKAH